MPSLFTPEKIYPDLNGLIFTSFRIAFLFAHTIALVIGSIFFYNDYQSSVNMAITVFVSSYCITFVFFEICSGSVNLIKYKRGQIAELTPLNDERWFFYRILFCMFGVTCIILALTYDQLIFSILLWISSILFMASEFVSGIAEKMEYTLPCYKSSGLYETIP